MSEDDLKGSTKTTRHRPLACVKYFWLKMLAYGFLLGIMMSEALCR